MGSAFNTVAFCAYSTEKVPRQRRAAAQRRAYGRNERGSTILAEAAGGEPLARGTAHVRAYIPSASTRRRRARGSTSIAPST